jgi:hypothetical protein
LHAIPSTPYLSLDGDWRETVGVMAEIKDYFYDLELQIVCGNVKVSFSNKKKVSLSYNFEQKSWA